VPQDKQVTDAARTLAHNRRPVSDRSTFSILRPPRCGSNCWTVASHRSATNHQRWSITLPVPEPGTHQRNQGRLRRVRQPALGPPAEALQRRVSHTGTCARRDTAAQRVSVGL